VPLEDPRDLNRAARRLQHHLILGPQTPGEQLNRLRVRLKPPTPRHPAILSDRDLTEITMHIQTNTPTHHHHLLTEVEQPSARAIIGRKLAGRAAVEVGETSTVLSPKNSSAWTTLR
jgi:hypothetical protein